MYSSLARCGCRGVHYTAVFYSGNRCATGVEAIEVRGMAHCCSMCIGWIVLVIRILLLMDVEDLRLVR